MYIFVNAGRMTVGIYIYLGRDVIMDIWYKYINSTYYYMLEYGIGKYISSYKFTGGKMYRTPGDQP